MTRQLLNNTDLFIQGSDIQEIVMIEKHDLINNESSYWIRTELSDNRVFGGYVMPDFFQFLKVGYAFSGITFEVLTEHDTQSDNGILTIEYTEKTYYWCTEGIRINGNE